MSRSIERSRIETTFAAAIALAAAACSPAPESQPSSKADQMYAYLQGRNFLTVTDEMDCRTSAGKIGVDPIQGCKEPIFHAREAKVALDRFRSEHPTETASFDKRLEARTVTTDDGKPVLTFIEREKSARSGQ